ncbi:MAG: VOC family protein [Pseudomonadota bacterium]
MLHPLRRFAAALGAFMAVFWSQTSAGEQPAPAIAGTVTFFYYEDLEAAAGFYGELLQLPVTLEEDWVRIYRITPTSSVGLVRQGRGFHAVSDDKPAMLSIVTDEVDAWYARLRAAAVPMLSELAPPGADREEGAAPVRGFIAEDPGGYTVEFFSWAGP